MARVLLTDDEKNIRNGLRAIISRTDTIFTEIDECGNGADALKMLSRNRYDLVITDLLMPQMDGLEMVDEIEGMENKPYIVILSGYDDFKYAQKAINYGVKAYLLKPVDRTELVNILKKAEAELLSARQCAGKNDAGNDNCYAGHEIGMALKYIRENYGKDLTMAEVANRISLNYSYFSLLFKEKTGENFIDYLKKVRMEKAKEMLVNTDYKIYEISRRVGYNNTKHFTTMFRIFTGTSPREFREERYSEVVNYARSFERVF